MNPRITTVTLLTLFALSQSGAGAIVHCDPKPHDCKHRRTIDLVICLDTSGSMQNMIDSARGRLWDVVNELAKARPTPRLRVGLLTYGTPETSTAAAGWVVKQSDLTHDLDAVYSTMMGMKTNGGDEFVGWVLNDALNTMSWTNEPNALKLIFVAGNESADQAADKFNFRTVCADARRAGITINAIFGGARATGLNEKWNEVAQHGGGSFSAIDMKCGTAQIAAPQDPLISELNKKLNETYVPYGMQGAKLKERQWSQDRQADELGAQTASSRAAAKATPLYRNESWDLVDAFAERSAELEKVAREELPPQMQSMSQDERKAYVVGLQKARSEIQQQIQVANEARARFIKEQRDKDQSGKQSLDDAILEALRAQAKEKGFTFEGA